MHEILYLSAEDTRELLGFDDALRVIEEVCHWQASGREALPVPRIYTLPVPEFDATYRIKASALPAIPIAGVRVTGYRASSSGKGSGDPENTRFVILSDPSTGKPIAIVDEHWTYTVRTCASGILAIRYLARPDAAVAGIVGAGNMAAVCARMLTQSFALKEIRVTSRRPESRESFARSMTKELGVLVEPRETARDVVEDADIVITCSSAREPLVFDGWLKEGAVLCGLGTEIDAALYRSVDKVVVSDVDVVKEAVEVREYLRQGLFSEAEIWSDLASIVTGQKPGRESASERIVVRASGLVSQDIAICYMVYRRALERGIGICLPTGLAPAREQ